MIKYV